MGEEILAVARWSYTGRWLIYETSTGKQVENVTDEFYQKYIKPLRYTDLKDAPDCVPQRAAAEGAA